MVRYAYYNMKLIKLELLVDKIMSNDICRDLIRGQGNVITKNLGLKKIGGHMWKGKADIINHDEKLIIDLKTTADISKFQYSARNTITIHRLIFTESYLAMN